MLLASCQPASLLMYLEHMHDNLASQRNRSRPGDRQLFKWFYVGKLGQHLVKDNSSLQHF